MHTGIVKGASSKNTTLHNFLDSTDHTQHRNSDVINDITVNWCLSF